MLIFLNVVRSGQEHVNSGDAIGFVVHDFTGASFDLLRGANCTLFGPTAVKEVFNINALLSHLGR